MGMQNPSVGEPLDKLAEVFPEGTPFIIDGIRTVEANTADYGKGEMVVVKVRGHQRELGIWGAYLLAQAKSFTPDDAGKSWVINRRNIAGFGKGRPVKVFDLAPEPAPVQQALSSVSAADPAASDDDIPF